MNQLVSDGGDDPRVDWRASVSVVGTVLQYLSGTLLIPLVVAVVYGEALGVFAVAALLTVTVGTLLSQFDPDPEIGSREGFLVVATTWLAVSAVGTLPYLLAAHGVPGLFGPTAPASVLGNPVNALFESMSGFTTTGATVLERISLERHSHAIMLWRQLTQWLGGMGIVVLAVAILPELSVGGAQLVDAEAPGVGIEKLTPRIAETARALWLVYLGFTLLEMVSLYGLHLGGLAPQMDAYNAVAHALTTLPTGGFSPEANSVAAFSAAVQWVVVPFMVVAGTNFALFWHVLEGEPRTLLSDAEFRGYLGLMAIPIAILTGLLFTGVAPPLAELGGTTAGTVGNSVRQAVFQVVSLVTTTGYATSDFAQWNTAGKFLMLVTMFVGGSGGSTGGAVKIVRWLVVAKLVRRELFTTIHPDAVQPVRLGGTVIDERALRGITGFTLAYLVIFFLATVLVVLDAHRIDLAVSLAEGASSVAATLGNVGPALGQFGPFGNYLAFPATTKLLMVFLMWIGRLEIIPVLVLLTNAYWRS
ncbi:MAG: Trk-type K+ transport system, membrane component [halophilic archaeon J07HB67]|nr:MAG: Trk-type K+ transport system, membrane component [halophilic archaeon J07HB67]